MQLLLTFQLILKSFRLRSNRRYSLTFASNSVETGIWREADRFSPAWHFSGKPPLALFLGARRTDQYRSQIRSVNMKWQQHGRCENDKSAPPEVQRRRGKVSRQQSRFLRGDLDFEVPPPAEIVNKTYFIHCHKPPEVLQEHLQQTFIRFTLHEKTRKHPALK